MRRSTPAKPLLTIVALLLISCGDDEEAPAGPGEVCDAEQSGTCEEGLVCATSPDGPNICQRPLGSACDLDDEEPFCIVGSVCFAAEEGAGDGTGSEDGGICEIPTGGECDETAEDPYCGPGLVCAEHLDDVHRCREPLEFRGNVFDAQSLDPIADAHVIALDEQRFAVTDVAVSDAEGDYALEVPVARDTDGEPVDAAFTLRADAADYQTFPSGPRRALPVHANEAELVEGVWVVENALTDVALLQLREDDRGGHAVSGEIEAAEGEGGVLVVVEGGGGAWSGLSDRGGAFTVFNVPDGEHTTSGYAAGLQLEPASVTMAGEDVGGVILSEAEEGTVDVSGSVQIVETEGETSVVLVVAATFDENLERGEVPRGLRAPPVGEPNVSGNFTIAGVPAGSYVVLAAFENDGLTRDPDQLIAGTEFVRLEVPAGGGAVTVDESFKVTEAIAIVGPGADLPEVVSSAPTLQWERDPSAEWYHVEVFDAFGDLVFEEPTFVGEASGTQELEYGGPLDAGMYYQLRVTSWRQQGGGDASPIARTEDLRGVFQASPE